MKTIALGSDHAGFGHKERVKAYLEQKGYAVLDFGTHSMEPCDYPDFVGPAARAVSTGEADLGVVFGGSGNGEAIVANKLPGIRCGLCWNEESARLTKLHNNANVIAIGGRMVETEALNQIIDTWLATEFEGGRHVTRIEKIRRWEAGSANL